MPSRAFIVQEILSGRRKGFWAALARALLGSLSLPYRLAVAMRNRLYDRKLRAVHCIDCRVISVGNLTAGGTGKTPLVEYLARHVLAKAAKVAIVSRGYGADEENEKSDEQLVLCENLPDVPHVAGADRVACAVVARRKHDARVVILDDAFQHRRIARDLDVVAIDATNPFGFGHLLPRGLLREPPESLARAHVVVITRSALVTPAELAAVEKDVARLAPSALVVHAVEDVAAVEDAAGNAVAPDSLKARPVVAFCGIGNPEAFRRTLVGLGVGLKAFLVFADHQRYDARELSAVDRVAAAEDVAAILTTQKDAVKLKTRRSPSGEGGLPADFAWSRPLRVVKIGMRLTKNEGEFLKRIDALIADIPSEGAG